MVISRMARRSTAAARLASPPIRMLREAGLRPCTCTTLTLSLSQSGQGDGPIDGVFDEADRGRPGRCLGLIGGEDLAGGQLVQGGRVFGTWLRPELDDLLEVGEAVVDQVLEDLAFLARSWAGEAAHVLQRIAGDRVFLGPDLLHQAGQVVVRNDHADRAGEAGRLGKDVSGVSPTAIDT